MAGVNGALAGVFLSTPSARRATLIVKELDDLIPHISIHALREEGDMKFFKCRTKVVLISIHALREEGDWLLSGLTRALGRFLSTPSARRATIILSGIGR